MGNVVRKGDELWGPRPPDFFLVGQPKSGTTALYSMLRQHPEVFMPDLKEPQFLSTDLRWRFPQPRYMQKLPLTIEEYLALFEGATPGQRIGEASGAYLFSRTAAASIAELNPDARIIVIFREPTSFLRSLHLQLLVDLQEKERDLRKAIALEAARERGRHVPRRAYRPQDLRYSEHVRYTEQLRRYHAVLPREQVLTLIYDDYRSDNEATVRAVYEFIGVDSSIDPEPVERNSATAVRSQLLGDTIHRFSVGHGPFSNAVKAGVKAVVPETTRRRLLKGAQSRVYRLPPPADADLMAELRIWLKPEVERFSEYLDRDLVKLWRYDEV